MLKENTVYKINSKQDLEAFLKKAEENGYTWVKGNLPTSLYSVYCSSKEYPLYIKTNSKCTDVYGNYKYKFICFVFYIFKNFDYVEFRP